MFTISSLSCKTLKRCTFILDIQLENHQFLHNFGLGIKDLNPRVISSVDITNFLRVTASTQHHV